MAFSGSALLNALPYTAAAVVVVIAVAFAVGRLVGRHNVVDTAWGLLFVSIAAAALLVSDDDGDPGRRWLLAAMTAVWGVRLAVHIGRGSAGKGEDPRYAELLSGARINPTLNAILKVYVPQAALAFLISAPIQVGSFESGPIGIVAVIGLLVWLVGLFFESVGDAQMNRYKRWKKHQPAPSVAASVMDKGLWRLTRHPNYFGDACVWWGIFLVTAESWPGVLTVPAPMLMTYLLTQGSGKKTLERSMIKRPGYPEYVKRTSAFVPLPPKKHPAGPPAAQPTSAEISLFTRQRISAASRT